MPGAFTPIPFGRTLYVARSEYAYGERLLNWYPEQSPDGKVSLMPTPGMKLWASVGTGPCRGLLRMGEELYAVIGSKAYVITRGKNVTELASIGGVGLVHMTANGTHVAIASTTETTVLNRTHLSTIAPSPNGPFNGATHQDLYGIFTKADSNQLWLTTVNDMTTMNALDFSTKSADFDHVMGCLSDHRELFVFGKRSTEVWYNSGNPNFAFSRVPNGFIERGIKSSHSPAKSRNAPFVLGDDSKVYAISGYTPQKMSTPGIQNLLDASVGLTSAEGFVYSQAGHEFYVLNTSGGTYVYDIDTQAWHERRSSGHNRWLAQGHADVFDKQIVGSYADDGNLYELDLDTYTDNGSHIKRQCDFPVIDGGGNRMSMSQLFLDFEPGVGLTSGQGSDPQAMLDYTEDGGKTYQNEVWTGIGKIGEYDNRAMWTRLGSFRRRSYRLTVTDPVKAVLTGAYARLEGRT